LPLEQEAPRKSENPSVLPSLLIPGTVKTSKYYNPLARHCQMCNLSSGLKISGKMNFTITKLQDSDKCLLTGGSFDRGNSI